MSATVLHFTPRAELEPQANLTAFVELCKQSDVLGARTQWSKNVWDIGYLRGNNKVHRAVFSTLEAARNDVSEPSMSEPFLDFAKAVLVYLHDKRPSVSQSQRVSALRLLEAALRDWCKGSRPTAVNVEVLDTAVELAKRQFSASHAYTIGGTLEQIAKLMTSKGFIFPSQSWTHGLKRPQGLGSRISKEALAARQAKLPSAAVLRALGGIFHEAVEMPDVLASSYTALLLCAPERINELLRLRRNCFVEGDGEFKGKLGLRWAGSKGFEDTTKWLPSEMAPIAREAVENLTKLTDPAQELAAWYTKNPTKLYLHPGVAHLRGKEVLTVNDIALVLWGDAAIGTSAYAWARARAKLASVRLKSPQRIGYRFAEVERAVIAMLPKTFPFMPGAPELKCEDAIAVVRTHDMNPHHVTYLCMFSCVDYGAFTNALGAYKGMETIFSRFGYAEDDGAPIKFNSHSLRHYLNMLAQVGGLTSTEIAIFSGRIDRKQNRYYDHMSSDEVQAPVSEALKAGFTSNLATASSRKLVTRSKFKGIGIVAAHTTEYGWCTHNFASEPCQMYRDCINCEEQECVKGEKHKEANLRSLKIETEYLLEQAREALNEEEYGADNWVRHQTQTLERVNALLAILDDVSVAAGARIRLDIANAPLVTSTVTRRKRASKTASGKALE